MSLFDALNDRLNAACLAHFGDTATYAPAGGVAVPIVGILDTKDDRKPERGLYGTFWVRNEDLPAVPQRRDVITIGGVAYELRGDAFKSESDGGVYLWLRKQ